MTLKKPELLAPVGSFESIHSAIKAGADAIYFGVEQLNMRTKSIPTICLEDIEDVSNICHNHGIKCYLTLNTVVYDYDMQLA
ncbi:MAG: putative protease YhbU precursor, partial [Bacteroidota bacterium]